MDDKSKDNISQILSNMKFKKKIFGGVDEIDVWKKIEKLQIEYEKEFDLQAQKYEAIISNLMADK